MSDRSSDAGQATPLILVAVLFAAILGLGVTQVGSAAARRSHAQAAADAAALAGAAAGEDEAARFAAANGAVLVSYRADADGVTVEVERAGINLQARARWVPRAIP